MLRRFAIAALVSCTCCSHAAPTGSETGSSGAHPVAPLQSAPQQTAPERALEDDLPKLAARAVAMYHAIARALAEPSPDCAAIAAKLGAIETANRDAITATAKVLHAGHDKIQSLRAALEPHQAELDASAQAIAASAPMKACSNDPGFAVAIDHLLGEP